LIRRICPKCKVPHIPTEFEMQELGLTSLPENATVFKPVGCPNCSQSGYSGRTVIHELMVVDDTIRSLIVRNSDAGTLKKAAVQGGMGTLREDGVIKVLQGLTTIDELMRATHAEV
jgi:general secretion pathway protein E